MGKRKNVILPPALPPDTPDEEFDVSDEDVDFFSENPQFTDFLTRIDKKQIDRQVTRVADKTEDEVEKLYEKRNRNAAPVESRGDELQVDPVDALPVKTLDGKLQYRTSKKLSTKASTESAGEENDANETLNLHRLTKAERRQQFKKEKKEVKKLNKDEDVAPDSPNEKLHSDVLKEVEEEISAEESLENKKIKLAEIGMALLENPEANIRTLRDLLQICEDRDPEIVKLGLMSMLAVFKDIIPSYRIRELTEKELAMQVSEAVRKTRYYEYTLLRSYKAYLQKLVALQRKAIYKQVTVRCMCTLLEVAPHFNFCETLLAGTIRNISSSDDIIRKSCCEAIKSLFKNEGKHGGEGTVRAVRLIAQLVKSRDCQLHPDSIYVLLSLRFDEDLRKPVDKTEEKNKLNKNKKGSKKQEAMKPLQPSETKKRKQELIAKTREEVYADYKAVSFAPDPKDRQRMQSDTLSAIFEIYFRILRRAVDSSDPRYKSKSSISNAHPLLAPCLDGLAKFSHLMDLDFMSDLMSCLKQLSGVNNNVNNNYGTSNNNGLTVTERLLCCIVAFKIMKSNLDALNVDLQDFFVQLYNLLIEYRPDRDRGEVLAEALKTMLWDNRQHDMQRAAAFIKRLATFSLSFGTAEAMSALSTLKQLLQKNTKCRNLLENDAGGGSISGFISKYQPEATDPYLSGALASVLWELSLLSKHYNPNVSQMASNILTMANLKPTQNISNPSLIALNPIQAFSESTIEKELSKPMNNKVPPSLKRRRKRERVEREFYVLDAEKMRNFESGIVGEEEAKVRFEEHFKVLRDISENERLKGQLNRTMASISLYDEFKREKIMKLKSGKKKAKV